MTSERKERAALDQLRWYANVQQEAGRKETAYVSVRLGHVIQLVMLADTLKADHADPALGWTTAAVEAELYERAERIRRRLTVLISTRGSKELQDAAEAVYADIPDPLADGTRTDVVGLARDRAQMLKLEREISSKRLTAIGELKDEIKALREGRATLEKDEAALREDLEYLQNQREDLEEKVRELERTLRAVEKAVETIRERLVEFLQRSGVRVTDKAAQEAALDLLGGLPGIPLAGGARQEDAEPHCSCGAPESNHPYKHPFFAVPPDDRPEGTR